MTLQSLPNPLAPVSTQDGTPTEPWYRYFKAVDQEIRNLDAEVTTLDLQVTAIGPTITVLDAPATTVPSHGVVLISTPSTFSMTPPVPGEQVDVVFEDGTTTNTLSLASTDHRFVSPTGFGRNITFISSGFKSIQVVGVSTRTWWINFVQGSSVTFTT